MPVKKRETLPAERGVTGIPRRGNPVAVRILGSGRDVMLPPGLVRFSIGSDPTNDLFIDDRYVSAWHCELERKARTVVLRDCHSRNGTYVNGTRIQETDVDVGARIQIGATMLALMGPRGTGDRPALDLLVGEDLRFRHAINLAIRAAASHANVLVVGESGTGKELVARLIHEASPRAPGPFVALNCASIPKDLIESELFGHERGAFTGAVDRRLGLFEQADGGTLFLDEIGELPVGQQPRLLRVLESRRLRRIGGQGEREVDVRVVAATHRDLVEASRSEAFRLDLYHRLCGVEVHIPPLRERAGDLPLLMKTFLSEEQDGDSMVPDEDTLRAMQRYHWPGNVRELRNAVHRAVILGGGRLLLRDLVPAADRQMRPRTLSLPTAIGPHDELTRMVIARDAFAGRTEPPVFMTVDEIMKCVMERALSYHGSYRRAAQALGMSRSTFHDKARRYGLAATGRDRDVTAAPVRRTTMTHVPGEAVPAEIPGADASRPPGEVPPASPADS
jgi:DNA-binding NtrC family response regulator